MKIGITMKNKLIMFSIAFIILNVNNPLLSFYNPDSMVNSCIDNFFRFDIESFKDSIIIILNNGSYSPYNDIKSKFIEYDYMPDSIAKRILIEDIDTLMPDYHEILENARSTAISYFWSIHIYDSKKSINDTIQMIPNPGCFYIKDFIIFNASYEVRGDIFQDYEQIVIYDIRNRKINRIQARNMDIIGLTDVAVYLIAANNSYIKGLAVNTHDIVKIDSNGINVITNDIKHELKKTNPTLCKKYLEDIWQNKYYYDGQVMFFSNDTTGNYKRRLKIQRQIKVGGTPFPLIYSFINDTIISLDSFNIVNYNVYNNEGFTILEKRKNIITLSIFEFYKIDKNGLQLFIKLSDYLPSYYLDIKKSYFASLLFFFIIKEHYGIFIINKRFSKGYDAFIIDLRTMKVVAQPKVIIKK